MDFTVEGGVKNLRPAVSNTTLQYSFEIITVQFVISQDFHHLKRKLQYNLLFNKFKKVEQ